MIVFDLDDTIYKEKDYVKSAVNAIADAVGHSGLMGRELALSFIEEAETNSRGLDNLAAALWEISPGNEFTVEKLVEIYRNHRPDISLPFDTKVTLAQLKARGVKMGIITDGPSERQRRKIEALGLQEYFEPEDIVISGDIGHEKTDPDGFLRIMSLHPEETKFVYVGDNPSKDFRWPNRLGWTTVQIDDVDHVNIHPQEIEVPDEYRAGHHVADFASVVNFV